MNSEALSRSNRILRVAIVLSLLVHLVLGLLFFVTYDELSRLLHVDRHREQAKPQPDEIVTISSSLHLEKRPKPVPVPAPARPAVQPKVVPQPQPVPAPQQVARIARPAAVPRPVEQAPSQVRHELSKQLKTATSEPVITRKAETVSRTPTAEPRTPAPEKVVASVEHPAAAAQPVPPSHSNKLSEEQLAQIQSDMAKTIAQARSQADPLRNVKPEPPAAPKSYRMQMQGMFGPLRRGEGYYYPIKGWHAGGLDWYYVSYEFTWDNGVYETGSVPWPIHFTPAEDPFVNGEIGNLRRTPLPPPPPGYVPPGTLGKALRAYFPNLTFSDSDN